MREFNTSGPNIPDRHYTIFREDLIRQGIKLVEKDRYFTIWAPRQTGKSTYFRQLAERLVGKNYHVTHINVENYLDATKELFLEILSEQVLNQSGIGIPAVDTYTAFETELKRIKEGKLVLIIDEIEGLNPEIFGQFLHTIRNLYHSRTTHCLKSVILVG
ncbi:MAG: ATP-binding protein, partial [Bacteroidetes bacterium]|nr:ATP-binding protein [Bacteroidota bacterium]